MAAKAVGIGALRVVSGIMIRVLFHGERAGAIPFETRVSISEVDRAFLDNGFFIIRVFKAIDNYTGQNLMALVLGLHISI